MNKSKREEAIENLYTAALMIIQDEESYGSVLQADSKGLYSKYTALGSLVRACNKLKKYA